jgi:hypothetical protein
VSAHGRPTRFGGFWTKYLIQMGLKSLTRGSTVAIYGSELAK